MSTKELEWDLCQPSYFTSTFFWLLNVILFRCSAFLSLLTRVMVWWCHWYLLYHPAFSQWPQARHTCVTAKDIQRCGCENVKLLTTKTMWWALKGCKEIINFQEITPKTTELKTSWTPWRSELRPAVSDLNTICSLYIKSFWMKKKR